MSGPVGLDRRRLALAFTEIEEIRNALPESALAALAQEVVKRVAENLVPASAPQIEPNSADIDGLCEALLSQDDQAAIAMIEAAQRKGMTSDTMIRVYLAEASCRLGQWWDEDKVSFYSVTLAAGRIYAILRILRLQRTEAAADLRRSAVFATVPGEQHGLGITMAADMARAKGWDIELFVGRTHDELIEVIGTRDTAVIGLSASARRSLPDLIKLIVGLRISNPKARVLICGQITSRNLNLYGITGADAVAPDFDTAMDQMERLLTAGPGSGL
ncbi:hypothetical protein GC209_03215 [bacterium]|nr:hypothetical protein [bacterium]